MSAVEDWLGPRLEGVAGSLRERILAAVRQPTDGRGALHDHLKAAGERLLAAAQSGPANRDTALTLLAADGLMTFACEAMAERDPAALVDLR